MYGLNDNQIQAALIANGTPDGTNGAGLITGSTRTVARFFMHATQDMDASEKAGRTIYRETPYVEVRSDGAKDSVSHPVTNEDRMAFPAEWGAFQQQRTKPMHSVMALPGFGACEFRYCDDARIFTIEALAETDVQPELAHMKAMALRWLSLLGTTEAEAPKKRGGRKPGSKNKPKTSMREAMAKAEHELAGSKGGGGGDGRIVHLRNGHGNDTQNVA